MSFKNFVSIKTGKLDANAQIEIGKYPFYTCAAIPSKIDTILDDCECVLLVGNGANTGMVFYNNGPFNAYQRTYIIRPLNKENVKYLYWYLCNYSSFLLASSIGSATNYIKLGDIQNLPDIKHDFTEQENIVKELDSLSSVVETKKSQLLALDELVKSRFISQEVA